MPSMGRRPTSSAAVRMAAESGTWDNVQAEVPHFIASSAINVVARNPYVFLGTLVAHGGYHLYERMFSGASDYGSIDTIVADGGIVYPELKGWVSSAEILPRQPPRKRIQSSKVASFRRCRTTSRPGKRCTRRIGHPMPHRF